MDDREKLNLLLPFFKNLKEKEMEGGDCPIHAELYKPGNLEENK